jgi:hypothetical protein
MKCNRWKFSDLFVSHTHSMLIERPLYAFEAELRTQVYDFTTEVAQCRTDGWPTSDIVSFSADTKKWVR